MDIAIKILEERWSYNADCMEYLSVDNPVLDYLLKRNESIQLAIDILKAEKLKRKNRKY